MVESVMGMDNLTYWIANVTVQSIHTRQTLYSFRGLFEVSEQSIINYGYSKCKEDYYTASDSVLKEITYELIMNATRAFAETTFKSDPLSVIYDFGNQPYFEKQYNGKLIPENINPHEDGSGVKLWILGQCSFDK